MHDLGQRVRERGMDWHHLPIVDLTAPGPVFEETWHPVAMTLRHRISAGGRVLVHCRGGLGRAGTVAACLLMEFGVAAPEAIQRGRTARPNAIETSAQERYVLAYRPRSVPPAN